MRRGQAVIGAEPGRRLIAAAATAAAQRADPAA
jgi:hypothetical protein